MKVPLTVIDSQGKKTIIGECELMPDGVTVSAEITDPKARRMLIGDLLDGISISYNQKDR